MKQSDRETITLMASDTDPKKRKRKILIELILNSLIRKRTHNTQEVSEEMTAATVHPNRRRNNR